MIVADQTEVMAFLARPSTWGAAGPVERVDTHISAVFLVGGRAYKLKRAVRFPYLDFSTPQQRRAACEAEIAINRRTAPALYLGVRAIRRGPGGLGLDGEGEAVDWLVEMRRFDQETIFERLAAQGRLDAATLEATAEAIARFHLAAEPRTDGGGRAGIAAIVESNMACFAEFASAFDSVKLDRLDWLARAALDRLGAGLERRLTGGFVRRCHGDLHLRNLCLVDGRPTLFDAIEFSEFLATIDVLYDLAFLLMDLDHRGRRDLANRVFNRYLDLTGDNGADGFAALALFLSLRAAVRAHVNAALAAGGEGATIAEARAYLDRAIGYLAPPPPRLIAIGGLSGTGKSRAPDGLAPVVGAPPGARIVRSDVIRKRLARVAPTHRLGPEGYAADMTERTYATLLANAEAALAGGRAAIADAVFARPEQRRAVEALAREHGVPFVGLWLEAPRETMEARVEARAGDASDATGDVVRRQLDYDLGPIAWRRVDASGSAEQTDARVIAATGAESPARASIIDGSPP